MTSLPNDDGAAQRNWLLPIGVAVLAGIGAAGGTFALWSDHDTAQAQFVSSGDLKISSLSAPTWHETSPDVTATPRVIDPATFLLRPGDSITVAIPFETTLRGDNLHTELSVDWSAESGLPHGVTGTYTLVDSRGNPLHKTPVELGEAMEFAAHDGGHYAVEVELDLTEVDTRFGAESPDPLSELGNFDVAVHQVRSTGGAS